MDEHYYVSVCPDTDDIFVCETGVDGNLAQVFARNDEEVAADTAQFVCDALNAYNLDPREFQMWRERSHEHKYK